MEGTQGAGRDFGLGAVAATKSFISLLPGGEATALPLQSPVSAWRDVEAGNWLKRQPEGFGGLPQKEYPCAGEDGKSFDIRVQGVS